LARAAKQRKKVERGKGGRADTIFVAEGSQHFVEEKSEERGKKKGAMTT